MTPTEHELTVATEALARARYDLARTAADVYGRAALVIPTWDNLHPLDRHQALEDALHDTTVVLAALPDRLDPIRTADANDSAPYDDTIDAVEATLRTYPA